MRGTRIAVAGAVLLCLTTTAHADAISARASQLRSASEYKVRVSAALWLAKQSDVRAVTAMTRALRSDRDHSVRAIAAVSLGKMVDETTPSSARDQAIDALSRAANGDRSARVRQHASASHRRLEALRTPSGDALPSVFVAVGATDGKVRLRSKSTRQAIEAAVRRSLRQHAPRVGHSTAADGLPTKSDLERSHAAGFRVSASIADLSVRRARGGASVSCAVTLNVNPWEGRGGRETLSVSQTASATGRGQVTAGRSSRAVSAARRDCVEAVIDQVVAKQIVPFLRHAADRRVAQTDVDEPVRKKRRKSRRRR